MEKKRFTIIYIDACKILYTHQYIYCRVIRIKGYYLNLEETQSEFQLQVLASAY